MRRISLGLAACAALLLASGGLRAADVLPTGPNAGDQALSPFYRWDGAPAAKAGVMLREEAQPAQADIDAASAARRILYSSTDVRWNSGLVPVSGTLYLPQGTAPAGGWPLLAWAHGTLGVADACAPSWAMHKPRDAAYINRWLKAGFAVVATDYQGLGGPGPHPYLIWQAESRSVLDSARAVLAARPGVIANAVIVSGQSQGSGPAVGSALLAREYAPDLKVLGVVGTGVVSTVPDSPYQPPAGPVAGGGSPLFTLLSLVGGGLRDGAPAVDSLVSAAGQPLLAETRRACTTEIAVLARQLKLDMAGTFAVSAEALAGHRLPVTDLKAVRVDVPMLLGTGLADRLIPPRRQYSAVAGLCAVGNAVTWKTYAGVGHNGSPHAAFDDALAFARARLAGQPQPGNCTEQAPPGPAGAMASGLPFND